MFSDKKDNSIQLGQQDKKPKNKDRSSKISTMPDVFYGGNDPEIYEEKNKAKQRVQQKTKQKEEQKKTKKEEGKQDKDKQDGQGSKKTNDNKKTNKKPIIIGVVTFLLLVTTVSAYQFYSYGYFDFTQDVAKKQPDKNIQQEKKDPEERSAVAKEEENKTETTTDEQVSETPTTTEEIQESTSTLVAQPLEFPSTLLSDTVDLDSDDLTDKEEVLYDTDSGSWDTDGDGYFDGQEISNLYSPTTKAPAKLIDSGVISEYTNPVFGYRMYYPSDWEVAAVDEGDYKQVLFSSIEGSFIEVRAEAKRDGESFEDWFARKAGGQSIQEISSFKNIFEQEGYKREDGLVSYFVSDNNVYVILYNKGTGDSISFRRTMEMMFQSFRLNQSDSNLPEQNVIPETNNTTTLTEEDNNNTSTTTTSTLQQEEVGSSNTSSPATSSKQVADS